MAILQPAGCDGTSPLLAKGCLLSGVLLPATCAPGGECQHQLDAPTGIDCSGTADVGFLEAYSAQHTFAQNEYNGHYVLTGEIPRVAPWQLGFGFVPNGGTIPATWAAFGTSYAALSATCKDAFDDCDATLPTQTTRLLFAADAADSFHGTAETGSFWLRAVQRQITPFGSPPFAYVSRTRATPCLQYVAAAEYPLWSSAANVFVETCSPLGIRYIVCTVGGTLTTDETYDAGGLLTTGILLNVRLPVCRITIPPATTSITLDIVLTLGIALQARLYVTGFGSVVLSEIGRQANLISTLTRTIVQSVTVTRTQTRTSSYEAIIYCEVLQSLSTSAPRVSPRTTMTVTNVRLV